MNRVEEKAIDPLAKDQIEEILSKLPTKEEGDELLLEMLARRKGIRIQICGLCDKLLNDEEDLVEYASVDGICPSCYAHERHIIEDF